MCPNISYICVIVLNRCHQHLRLLRCNIFNSCNYIFLKRHGLISFPPLSRTFSSIHRLLHSHYTSTIKYIPLLLPSPVLTRGDLRQRLARSCAESLPLTANFSWFHHAFAKQKVAWAAGKNTCLNWLVGRAGWGTVQSRTLCFQIQLPHTHTHTHTHTHCDICLASSIPFSIFSSTANLDC